MSTGQGAGPPARITISSPRMRAARVRSGWPVSRDIDEQTELGAVYIAALIRGQRWLAVQTCLIVAVVVIGLPLVFASLPGLAHVRFCGIRLPWFVLGLCVQPVWIVAAWWHVRRAERHEREFALLVERS